MTELLLCGYPGKMTREIELLCSESVWADRFRISNVALGSGRDHEADRRIIASRDDSVPCALEPHTDAIGIEFSTPAAALANLRLLSRAGIWSVVGTTGFDRTEAERIIASSPTSAVIAPNMCIPIVLAQAGLRHLAERFPGALEGMNIHIRESHQSTKRDTSGTAIAFAELMRQCGLRIDAVVDSIRDPERQRKLGVPESALAGHGWHWFDASDESGSVQLGFETRVSGRRAYAEGALRAAEFLATQRSAGVTGRVYSMEDVLAATRA